MHHFPVYAILIALGTSFYLLPIGINEAFRFRFPRVTVNRRRGFYIGGRKKIVALPEYISLWKERIAMRFAEYSDGGDCNNQNIESY